MVIRLNHCGGFKRHHGDYKKVKYSFQKIINACNLVWDERESPALLNEPRYGQYGICIVSRTRYLYIVDIKYNIM